MFKIKAKEWHELIFGNLWRKMENIFVRLNGIEMKLAKGHNTYQEKLKKETMERL